MFGIGMPEMIMILAVALIVIGPKKLPDLAKTLGKALGEFKRATNDFKDSISMESTLNEVKEEFKDFGKKVRDPLDKDSTDHKKSTDSETLQKADHETTGTAAAESETVPDSAPPFNAEGMVTDKDSTESEKTMDSEPSLKAGPDTTGPAATMESETITEPESLLKADEEPIAASSAGTTPPEGQPKDA